MGSKTAIEWCDATWNPVTGCSPVGAACDHCYAKLMAERFPKNAGGAKHPFKVTLHEDRLDWPLHRRKPLRIFAGSMTDFFHDDVPIEFIAEIFNTMCAWQIVCRKKDCGHEDPDCWRDPGHTYMMLTKRPERMCKVINEELRDHVGNHWAGDSALSMAIFHGVWPLPNVWLGTSIWDQESADRNIPHLLRTPAAKRFVSAEPLLGAVKLPLAMCEKCGVLIYEDGPWCPGCQQGCFGIRLDQIIVGGENGSGARPMHPDWVRRIRDDCVASHTPFFFKGWGAWYNATDDEDGSPLHQKSTEDHIFTADGDMLGAGYRYGRESNGAVEEGWRDKGGAWMCRVGKKYSGRELDGREWNEIPEVS